MNKIDLSRIIRPQRQVDLIVSMDFKKEEIDVRPTVIYDIVESPKRIIIAQTNPPVLKSMVGRYVEATFLIKGGPGEESKRIGYKTRILNLLPEYTLRQGGAPEQALTIGFPRKKLNEISLRLHYRVYPSQSHQILVSMDNRSEGISLVDLSLGGMRIICSSKFNIEEGQKVSLVLNVGETAIPLKGRVVKILSGPSPRVWNVGIKFEQMDSQAAGIIQQTVNHIMRQELKKRSGLGGQSG